MALALLIPEQQSTDAIEEQPDLAGLGGDPVLGFARVISEVRANTRHFRGWGPSY